MAPSQNPEFFPHSLGSTLSKQEYQHKQTFYPPPPGSSDGGSSVHTYPPPPNTQTPPQHMHSYSPPPQQQNYNQYYPSPDSNRSLPTPSEKEPFAYPSPPTDNSGNTATSGMAPLNTAVAANMPGGAPAQSHFVGAGSTIDDVGTFNGGSYRVSHRDTNSILTIQLAMGCPLTAKPGAMIAMSPTMTLKGAVKISLKKIVAGGHLAHSTFTGPGELLLAPPSLGDITNIRLTGEDVWSVGKDAFLACTSGVIKDYKAQSISKALFSGEGLFTYKISGSGLLWISSLGAIIRKDEGERYLIDNGHLVAWNCKYILERIASGGIVSTFSAGEGLVCKFTGPGTIFFQTRNPVAFAQWVSSQGVTG
ncbi:hypothetical protein MBLNU459_g0649t2 [Dothideomycetes sp. NU459]